MKLSLKKTKEENLKTLFFYQTDDESSQMAAFTSEDPNDEKAYREKWTRIINNPQINMQTIFRDNIILGSVMHFDMMNETNILHWIGRKYWGNGIATKALKLFLEKAKKRPLIARAAFDNYGSQKVLEKCGFEFSRTENGFSNARKKEIEEYFYKLEK